MDENLFRDYGRKNANKYQGDEKMRKLLFSLALMATFALNARGPSVSTVSAGGETPTPTALGVDGVLYVGNICLGGDFNYIQILKTIDPNTLPDPGCANGSYAVDINTVVTHDLATFKVMKDHWKGVKATLYFEPTVSVSTPVGQTPIPFAPILDVPMGPPYYYINEITGSCPAQLWEASGKGTFAAGHGALAFECLRPDHMDLLTSLLPDGEGRFVAVQLYHGGGPFNQKDDEHGLTKQQALALLFQGPAASQLNSGSFHWEPGSHEPRRVESGQIHDNGLCTGDGRFTFSTIENIEELAGYQCKESGTYSLIAMWNSNNDHTNPTMILDGLSWDEAMSKLLTPADGYNSASMTFEADGTPAPAVTPVPSYTATPTSNSVEEYVSELVSIDVKKCAKDPKVPFDVCQSAIRLYNWLHQADAQYTPVPTLAAPTSTPTATPKP